MDTIAKNCRNQTYYSWGIQSGFTPQTIERAQGCYLYTTDGKKHLDLSSQLVLSNIGYTNERVTKAINEQMQKVHFVAPYFATEIRDKASAKLLEVLPKQMGKILYTLGGAESNENAVKIAQLYTGKTKIITRYKSYHGGTYLASQLGGDPRRHLSPTGVPWVVRINDSGTDEDFIKQIEQTIEIEGANTIAAIMLEGYSGSSGVLQPQSDAFWKRLQTLCRSNNILIIFDEVMSGFGRTGKWFGHQHFPIEADIITMAKGLTAGYLPLGAVATTKAISDHFETHNFNCGLTYNAHPTSLAASYEVISVYQDENLIERSAQLGELLKARLEKIVEKFDCVVATRGVGLHQVLEFNLTEWNKPQSESMKKMIELIKAQNIHVFSRWNYLFITPPLIIEWEELSKALDVIESSIPRQERSLEPSL
jgi:taurine--2-oxoglutarate transaminase